MDDFTQRIEEAFTELYSHDDMPPDYEAVLVAAVRSGQFVDELRRAFLPSGDLTEQARNVTLSLVALLWVGMQIERARNEVVALERMFGGDGA
jgi:hypothetical protein